MLAIEAATFGSPPQSDGELQRRRGRLAQLSNLAHGHASGTGDLDEYGRVILRTGTQVQHWMKFWATATHA